MNLYFRDPVSFQAEYQNAPLEDKDDNTLSTDEIMERVNVYKRGVVPSGCDFITAFVDVQKELLFYTVMAWKKDFTGYVIDYGAWPKQRHQNFRYAQARKTISKEYPGVSFEVALKKALTACIDDLCGKTWVTDDGTEMSISRLLIDANWGESTPYVYSFCRESTHRSVLYPSHGKFVGASSAALNDRVGKKNAVIGTHWRITKGNDVPIRNVLYDTNFWKSFFHSRLSTEPGTRGSVTFYAAQAKEHRTIAAHCKSEYAVRTEGRGRQVDEWKHRADRPDNHWFDCLVGCCVAASIEGATMGDRRRGLHGKKKPVRQKAVSYL